MSKPTYPTLLHYLTMLNIMNGILADRPDKKILYPFIVWSMKIKQWDNKNYSTAITNVDFVTNMINK